MKVIFKQLWNWITVAKYPCVETWGYWNFKFVNFNCKYNHLKTLYNYLINNKKL